MSRVVQHDLAMKSLVPFDFIILSGGVKSLGLGEEKSQRQVRRWFY